MWTSVYLDSQRMNTLWTSMLTCSFLQISIESNMEHRSKSRSQGVKLVRRKSTCRVKRRRRTRRRKHVRRRKRTKKLETRRSRKPRRPRRAMSRSSSRYHRKPKTWSIIWNSELPQLTLINTICLHYLKSFLNQAFTFFKFVNNSKCRCWVTLDLNRGLVLWCSSRCICLSFGLPDQSPLISLPSCKSYAGASRHESLKVWSIRTAHRATKTKCTWLESTS